MVSPLFRAMMAAQALTMGLASAALAAAPAASHDQSALTSYSLERSATFEVRSKAGEIYQVMVAWPAGEAPAEGWPVLYVLDGEDNFAIAALTARRLARAGERSGVQSGIVIGIAAGPLPRRVRDYTPPVPGYNIPAGQPASGLSIGGGEAFLDLVADTIMPAVRERWRVDASRETLVGHSFGGLLAVHALLTRPKLFDAAVAISPSFWFGNGLIAREAAEPRAAGPARRLLVAEGGDGGRRSTSSDSAAAVVQRLQSSAPLMHTSFLDLPEQSHGTTFLAAIVPAIRFAFGSSER